MSWMHLILSSYSLTAPGTRLSFMRAFETRSSSANWVRVSPPTMTTDARGTGPARSRGSREAANGTGRLPCSMPRNPFADWVAVGTGRERLLPRRCSEDCVRLSALGRQPALSCAASSCSSDDLRQALLETATRLIRDNRAAEANSMLELAWCLASQNLRNAEADMDTPFLRELKRRRALCFRQLGQTEAARELLARTGAAMGIS